MAVSDADRERAAELYAEARRLHGEQDYFAARERPRGVAAPP